MKTFSAYYSIIQRIFDLTLREAYFGLLYRTYRTAASWFSPLLIRIRTIFISSVIQCFNFIIIFFVSFFSWVTLFAQLCMKAGLFFKIKWSHLLFSNNRKIMMGLEPTRFFSFWGEGDRREATLWIYLVQSTGRSFVNISFHIMVHSDKFSITFSLQ